MFTIEGRGNTILPVPVPKTEISQSSLLRRFARDDKGQIAIIFGLTTFIVCALVGGAIDIGRWVSARNQTQAAIDSALLAAGRTAQTTYGDATKSINAAKAYYAQMKSSIVVNDSITFVANSTATSFTATGTAYVATPFLQFACPQIMPGCQSNPFEKLPVLTEGGTKQAESTIAQGGNSGSSIEIGLMLDTTGSMAGQKIEDLKAAAKDLVEIVVWDDQSNFTSRIGLAPFSGAVNVGDYFQTLTNLSAEAVSHTETQQTGETPIYTYPASCYNSSGKLKSSCKNKSQYITGYTPIYETVTVIDSTAKAKCVVERTGTSELTETVPGPGSWIPSWNVVRSTSSLNLPGIFADRATDEQQVLALERHHQPAGSELHRRRTRNGLGLVFDFAGMELHLHWRSQGRQLQQDVGTRPERPAAPAQDRDLDDGRRI